jgi:histone H2A
MGMSRRAMSVCNSATYDLVDRLAKESKTLCQIAKTKTLSCREIESAVRLIFPKEMATQLENAGRAALTTYTQPSESYGKASGKSITKTVRAGLIVSVGRVFSNLKKLHRFRRVGCGTAVYTAAVIERFLKEILCGAGNEANNDKRVRIIPRHLFVTIQKNHDLRAFFSHITIATGGVMPHIPETLLPPPPRSSGKKEHTTKEAKKKPAAPASSQKSPKKKVVPAAPPAIPKKDKTWQEKFDDGELKVVETSSVSRHPLAQLKHFYAVIGVSVAGLSALSAKTTSDEVDAIGQALDRAYWEHKENGPRVGDNAMFSSEYLYNVIATVYKDKTNQMKLYTLMQGSQLLAYTLISEHPIFRKAPFYHSAEGWKNTAFEGQKTAENIVKAMGSDGTREVLMVVNHSRQKGAGSFLLSHLLTGPLRGVPLWGEISSAAYPRIWRPLGFQHWILHDKKTHQLFSVKRGNETVDRSSFVYRPV